MRHRVDPQPEAVRQAFSAVRSIRGSRGCGWNSAGVSTIDQLARQTGRCTVKLAKNRSAGAPSLASKPGTGAWISRSGLPQLVGQPPKKGAQRSAAVSAYAPLSLACMTKKSFLCELGEVGQLGFRCLRQAQMCPDHTNKFTHCGGGLRQLRQYLPRALCQAACGAPSTSVVKCSSRHSQSAGSRALRPMTSFQGPSMKTSGNCMARIERAAGANRQERPLRRTPLRR